MSSFGCRSIRWPHKGSIEGALRMKARSLPTARFLMCRPQHFAVAYMINPWMDPRSWAEHDRVFSGKSQREWTRLYRTLSRLGGEVELVTAVPGLPDLV